MSTTDTGKAPAEVTAAPSGPLAGDPALVGVPTFIP